MKVFNKEINSCSECNYFNHTRDLCGELKIRLINKTNNFDFKPNQEISNKCPFNKPFTKKDIESFGFKFIVSSIDDWYEKIGEYETNSNPINRFYKIQLHIGKTDYFCNINAIEVDNEEYALFKGTITSKPHLEFILQTLNII